MKTAIAIILSATLLLLVACPKSEKRTIQSPHFGAVEIIIHKDGELPKIHTLDTSQWISGSIVIDTEGVVQDRDYTIKIIYLGESRTNGVPADLYRIHATGEVFHLPIGGSSISDRHVRPIDGSGMNILSGVGMKIYMKVGNKPAEG